jgi:protein TonB
MTKPTILLVDYDPTSIQSTLDPLARAGYDVTVAKNGAAGLEAFQRINPDLVLTQMMLPRIAGLDLCREIRRTRPTAGPPILVFGTSPAEKGRSQAIAAGADGYIVAPIDPKTIIEASIEYLTGRSGDPPEETRRPAEPGAADSNESLSDENGPGAVAAEILERLDALLPSKRVEVREPWSAKEAPAVPPEAIEKEEAFAPPSAREAPAAPPEANEKEETFARPSVQEAPAAPPKAIREEKFASPTEPPHPRRAAAPTLAAVVPATARPVSPPVPRQGSTQTRFPWGRVLAALSLGAGLLAVVLNVRVRTFPDPALRAPESSGVGRSVPPEATAQVAETSTENRLAAATSKDSADLTPVTRSPERRSAEARSELPHDGSKAAAQPSPESTRRESGTPVPTMTPSTSPAAEAHALPPEPVPVPAPAPAIPDASTQSDEASRGPSEFLSADPPEPTTLEPPVTAGPSSPAPIHPGDFVEVGSVDTSPVAKTRAQPAYPEFARRMRYSGTVVLRILVDETGSVTEAAPADDSARQDFLAAAIRAVRTWTYSPATKNGVPVKTRVTVRIAFQP